MRKGSLGQVLRGTLSIYLILKFLLAFLSSCSINLYRYKRILIVSTYNPKISYKAVCDVERNFNNPSFQFYFELLISLVYLYTTMRLWKYWQKVDFISKLKRRFIPHVWTSCGKSDDPFVKPYSHTDHNDIWYLRVLTEYVLEGVAKV